MPGTGFRTINGVEYAYKTVNNKPKRDGSRAFPNLADIDYVVVYADGPNAGQPMPRSTERAPRGSATPIATGTGNAPAEGAPAASAAAVAAAAKKAVADAQTLIAQRKHAIDALGESEGSTELAIVDEVADLAISEEEMRRIRREAAARYLGILPADFTNHVAVMRGAQRMIPGGDKLSIAQLFSGFLTIQVEEQEKHLAELEQQVADAEAKAKAEADAAAEAKAKADAEAKATAEREALEKQAADIAARLTANSAASGNAPTTPPQSTDTPTPATTPAA